MLSLTIYLLELTNKVKNAIITFKSSTFFIRLKRQHCLLVTSHFGQRGVENMITCMFGLLGDSGIRTLLLVFWETPRLAITSSESLETRTDTPDCKEFLEALRLWAERLLPTTLPGSAGTLADTCGCRGLTKLRRKVGKGRFFDLSIFRDRLSLLLYSRISWSNSLGAIVGCTLMSRIRL